MTTAGVIVLGNSGVGKSFLGNAILGQEAFDHKVRSRAVTLVTEYKECQINGKQYAVYNIPGLIENDQECIDINKREIDRAFRGHPYGVVLYVFGGGNGGRIRWEDTTAFNAINGAYPLGKKSLIVIVNNIPNIPAANEKSDYESDTASDLKAACKMDIEHICFIYSTNVTSTTEKQAIQTKLLDKIKIALPKIHNKEHEIYLQAAELSKLKKQMADLLKQIEEERKQNEKARKQMEDERKQHQLALERERAFRDMERLHIRDSMPSPVPYYVPVPTCSSGSGIYPGSGGTNHFARRGPLKKDGTPDMRYKANW
ncbi:unnamed protein product [Rotaria sordida]|uniref:AIG1-type G domain-containing protein n=1 Tax=Rotaria sordida TaxID=392033 RepID=A0A815UDB5_9BILA|nr:unnamed protein product [Rotaria sordida]CAF4195015.1 unnamed protein product [Rotaria sordida]